jgi:hypothetical protein
MPITPLIQQTEYPVIAGSLKSNDTVRRWVRDMSMIGLLIRILAQIVNMGSWNGAMGVGHATVVESGELRVDFEAMDRNLRPY